MIFIYLVGCHFVGVLRIRFLLGFVSGTLPTRTRPRFENTYGFPREFTPEKGIKIRQIEMSYIYSLNANKALRVFLDKSKIHA